ncbi:hypothetical protein GCM10023238_39870 [Streptomyces heliomycini]
MLPTPSSRQRGTKDVQRSGSAVKSGMAEEAFGPVGPGRVEAGPFAQAPLETVAVDHELRGRRQRTHPVPPQDEDPGGVAAVDELHRFARDLLQGRVEGVLGQEVTRHGSHLPREVPPVHRPPPGCLSQHTPPLPRTDARHAGERPDPGQTA